MYSTTHQQHELAVNPERPSLQFEKGDCLMTFNTSWISIVDDDNSVDQNKTWVLCMLRESPLHFKILGLYIWRMSNEDDSPATRFNMKFFREEVVNSPSGRP